MAGYTLSMTTTQTPGTYTIQRFRNNGLRDELIEKVTAYGDDAAEAARQAMRAKISTDTNPDAHSDYVTTSRPTN
jgi:hypothetical protein